MAADGQRSGRRAGQSVRALVQQRIRDARAMPVRGSLLEVPPSGASVGMKLRRLPAPVLDTLKIRTFMAERLFVRICRLQRSAFHETRAIAGACMLQVAIQSSKWRA